MPNWHHTDVPRTANLLCAMERHDSARYFVEGVDGQHVRILVCRYKPTWPVVATLNDAHIAGVDLPWLYAELGGLAGKKAVP